ncbi:MAG TPA: STAS domain-containing protein [Saprospiraceae bacterium]|nr:STAS domain-containing protein [Saprospiraceae bacterium]MCB9328692.1 STAS domain-containing protein [Lewinellaceae bacterium]HPK09557.1 STAS domain-containing protein [Saprospiraceae bacterium]HRX28275.1 STAS domain-containing protein [Saprospiraceae bacterium]
MKFTLDKNEDFSVFKLNEENLNSIMAPNLKSEFIFLRNEGVRNLILDMTDVKYVDSSGLSSILTANRLWNGYGTFVVCGAVHPSVKKLIEISHLGSILTLVPTLEEAREYIFLDSIERQLKSEEE